MLSLCLVMRKVRGRDVEWWVWLLGELSDCEGDWRGHGGGSRWTLHVLMMRCEYSRVQK